MMTDQQILSAVQAAFSPLRCTAEIWDRGQMLRLRVVDSKDNVVLAYPKQNLGAIRQADSLRAFLEMLRAQAQSKGHKLGPLKVA